MYNHMCNEEILKYVREEKRNIFGHCNTGTTTTNKKGSFGSIECWLNKEGIAKIFSIPKLEEIGFFTTQYREDKNYILHTKDWEVQFNKDKMHLP